MDEHARVGVLGPVRAAAGGASASLGAGKAVALLGLLALDRRRIWSDDEVIAALWAAPDHGDRDHVTSALRVHASELRRRLAPVGLGLEWAATGYRLVAPDGCVVDLDQARAHVERADASVRFGAVEQASREYALALRLWTGTPLADVDAPYAVAVREHLEYWHRCIRQNRLEADLRLGLGALHLEEARELCEIDRYDERACRHRIVALAQAGRRSEALDVYARFRRRLVRALGVEPGPELVAAQAHVLRGVGGGSALRRAAW